MTVSEARSIVNAKLKFGDKPDANMHRQARELLADWEEFQRLPDNPKDLGPKSLLLRKHPSFARQG